VATIVYRLDWFVREVFDPAELDDFLNVFRYTMLDCLRQAEAMGQAGRKVALSDIHAHVARLGQTTPDQEYDSSLEVRGQGGTLWIRVAKRNLLRLRFALAMQALKVFVVVAFSVFGGIWLCSKGPWPILIAGGIISLSITSCVWDRLQKLRAEVRKHERKRKTWIAAT